MIENKENNAKLSLSNRKSVSAAADCHNCIKHFQSVIDRVMLSDKDIYFNSDSCNIKINNKNGANSAVSATVNNYVGSPKPANNKSLMPIRLETNGSNNVNLKCSNSLSSEQISDKVLTHQMQQKSPLVSINVIDTDNNLNVCMCALMYNPDDTILLNNNSAEPYVQETEEEHKICPICLNIIKQQPNEHRPTLVSKKTMLANDVVVNRIDSHFLSISNSGNSGGKMLLHEPYTPESCESHSPLPDSLDEKEFPVINSTVDSPDILENIEKLKHKRMSLEASKIEDECDDDDSVNNLPTNTITTAAESVNQEIVSVQNNHHNHTAVSPRQLKSRLEILRRESQLGFDVNSTNNVVAVADSENNHNDKSRIDESCSKRKKDRKCKCCTNRACVII